MALVLRSLLECSDKEVFDKVRSPHASPSLGQALSTLSQVVPSVDGSASFAAERVEVMLQETASLGLHTRAQCLAHLGRHFRPARSLPARSPVAL